jgi:cytochrome c553
MRRQAVVAWLISAGAFSILPVSALAQQAPDGKQIFLHGNVNGAMPCASCHGPLAQGNPASGAPKLAGLAPDMIVNKLKDFAAGSGNPTMQVVAQALSPDEMQAVAHYVSKLPSAD